MRTFFASPERSTQAELADQAGVLCNSPVIGALMNLLGGLVAVINENRQLVALNHALLEHLGIRDAESALGLRLGEAVRCIHADRMDAGCGTSEYCATCGAVIAMVLSMKQQESVERDCYLEAWQDDRKVDAVFRVLAQPLHVDGLQFTLLFLQDRSREHEKEILERIFLHDITNLVSGIQAASQLLVWGDPGESEATKEQIAAYTDRLAGEISMHRMLLDGNKWVYSPQYRKISLQKVVEDLQCTVCHHPATSGKHILWPQPVPQNEILTDDVALLRVLNNMLINALEASTEREQIRFSITIDEDVRFEVWNPAVIPEMYQRRIFQRNFSTKEGQGRGLGTYAMRYLSEEVLQAEVLFVSREGGGTTFVLRLPQELQTDDVLNQKL